MDTPPAELPVLNLALIGFSPAEHSAMELALSRTCPGLNWRQSSVNEADALFASGARATLVADGFVQLGCGVAGARPVLIDLSDTRRPLAFSLPVSAPTLATLPTFDLRKPDSIEAMLVQFSGWLRPMAIQFWLASRIVQERLDLNSTVYHVSLDGRLQAILSRRTGVGVLPIADPGRLVAAAVWARRPGLADEIPGHFVQAPLPQILWQYAMRTTRNLLPTYFRSGPLYWCRAPQLPQRMFKDSHLMIVREIANAPISFEELGRRTKLADAVLSRDLAALRIVGAVTQDRKHATRSVAQASRQSSASGEPARGGRGVQTTRHGERRGPVDVADRTAPAPLAPQNA